MESLVDRWDARYRSATNAGKPAAVLLEHQHLLPTKGNALDLACGLGANALLLAERGFHVSAWDVSPVAIKQLQGFAASEKIKIQTQCRDVILSPPEGNSFDLIVVSDFLHRSLCPAISHALKPGGVLYYQTFCRDKLTLKGPSNPDYLLADNELLRLFASLRVRHYRENARCGDLQQGQRDRAELVAQRPFSEPQN